MKPAHLSIADYSYTLPEENIAYYPLSQRDASRLLIYREGGIRESTYRDIADFFPEASLLVFNNTRVVEARIVFQKPTGGRIEIFCLEPPAEYGGIAQAMSQTGSVRWRCLIGGASKWKPGQVLQKTIDTDEPSAEGLANTESGATAHNATTQTPSHKAQPLTLEARFLGKEGDAFLIELAWQPAELSFAGLLHRAGLIPLPPYISRAAEPSDNQRYKTIYAQHDGSVAAPTAGLHFTDAIFESLDKRHINRTFVTLHVGAGTFLPVKSATLGEHIMHMEFIVVAAAVIYQLKETLAAGRLIVPVGTTSTRTIESLYWMGVKVLRNPSLQQELLTVEQWDAYDLDAQEPVLEALTALLDWMKQNGLEELMSKTQLLIAPGYRWRIVRGLVTNFHQPESTLLLLIAALIGQEWRRVYDYALEHGFRFLSYGDGCLLWGDESNQFTAS